MTDSTQENAMTEIALALAMGFFAIMVLTAMSMGVGTLSPKKDPEKAIASAMLAPPATGGAAKAEEKLHDDDQLVIFDGTRFLDRNLKPLDPTALDGGRRIVLAVDPALPMAQAMAARQRFGAGDLVVTTLDAGWRRALAGARR